MAKKRKPATADRLPTKARLRQITNNLWSFCIKVDWNFKCAVCGARDNLNSHHLIKRGNCQAHIYTLRNGMCLCSRHHEFDSLVSAHGDSGGFVEWLQEQHPAIWQWMREHERDKLPSSTITQGWYTQKLRELRQYVEEDDFARICGPRLVEWLSTNE